MAEVNECNGILAEHFYHFKFKDKQYDVVRSILNGKDTIGLLPTGYGKGTRELEPIEPFRRTFFNSISVLPNIRPDRSVDHGNHTSYNTSGVADSYETVTADQILNPYHALPHIGVSNENPGDTENNSPRRSRVLASSVANTIKKESRKIRKLFNALKRRECEVIRNFFGVPNYPKNDHLINVIPEGKSWGVLHYLVKQNRAHELERLLRFKSCDKTILSKRCKLQNGKIDKWNAQELAEELGYGECAELLSKAPIPDTSKHLDTFYNLKFDTGRFPLLNIALAIYKKTFHPESIASNVDIFDVLKSIFQDINASEERWMLVKRRVCSSIESIDRATFETLRDSRTKKAYTSDSRLYSELNDALRRQMKSKYMPTATDFERSPFVLMYEMILLYWDKLEKESENTYRRMLLTDKDLALYQVGEEFIWMSFVSSSRSEAHSQYFPTCNTKGENIIAFTFINSEKSYWQPRNIQEYAIYAENERTYPAGARFKITQRETKADCTHVTLKLING